MYLIFNNELDKVYVNLSWNYNFWNKFLNFGGTKYNSYVRNTKCGVNVEYEYPTLRTLINSNEQDNINKLYILAEKIKKKYEKNKNIINKQIIRKRNKNNYQHKRQICINQGCKIKSRGKGKFICNCNYNYNSNHFSTNV